MSVDAAITSTPATTSMPAASTSQYHNLYKKNTLQQSRQTERRIELLQIQKTKRNQNYDDTRDIVAELIEPFLDTDFTINDQNNQQKAKKDRGSNRKYLQLSEWMTETPDDLDKWIMVPCPKGIRVLVITVDRSTKTYDKMGRFQQKFHSTLPGNRGGAHTILDCIYDKKTKQYFVLDVLMYKNLEFINCDAQMRFYFVQSKIEEDNLSVISARNEYAFRALPTIDCANICDVEHFLSTYPIWDNNTPALDGFLFYHKESIYVQGKTPLVCWLFPFMIPDMLPVEGINCNYMKDKPIDYIDHWTYISNFDRSQELKQKKKNRTHFNGKVADIIDDNGMDI